MIRWARYQLDHGHVPLSGWYPYLSTGLPLFTHYQSLAHILAALASYVFGVDTVYYWSLYLLLSLWPLSVYWGARLLGLTAWPSALAALTAPVVISVTGYGFEDTSFTWWGLGMWSQLWGMWLLPIVLGLTWRAIDRDGSIALAALSLGILTATHFLTAYLAFVAIPAFLIAGGTTRIPRRTARAALTATGAAGAAIWVIVPVLQGFPWHATSAFMRGTFWVDSYPIATILRWLVTGQLFDAGRLPIVTVAAALGLVLTLYQCRQQRPLRALLAVGLVSLFLFSGRATWGSLMNLLPGTQDLFMHRYLNGLQLAAIWIAGVGLAGAAHLLTRAAGRADLGRFNLSPQLATPATAAIAALTLTPAWIQVGSNRALDAGTKTYQQTVGRTQLSDVQILVALAKKQGGGRVYAGSSGNWGHDWKVGFVPVYNVLENEDADAVGFLLRTPALMSDAEAFFDPSDPSQYDLLNVRYLLVPPGQTPLVSASLVAALPTASLWQVNTTGYVEVVDTVGPAWDGNRDDVGATMRRLLASGLPAQHRYQLLKFPKTPDGAPTASESTTTPPGKVDSQSDHQLDGTFDATVTLTRPGAVVLKADYDPDWVATVDGQPVTPHMVAPAYPAIDLGAGTHVIHWSYQSRTPYPLLFLVAVVVLVAIHAGERRLPNLEPFRRLVAESPARGSTERSW